MVRLLPLVLPLVRSAGTLPGALGSVRTLIAGPGSSSANGALSSRPLAFAAPLSIGRGMLSWATGGGGLWKAGGAVCAVSGERRSMSSAPEQPVMAAEKKPVVKHTLRNPPKQAPQPKAKKGTESPRKGESGTKPGEKSERSKFREVLLPAPDSTGRFSLSRQRLAACPCEVDLLSWEQSALRGRLA
jgi:hypothetical protein